LPQLRTLRQQCRLRSGYVNSAAVRTLHQARADARGYFEGGPVKRFLRYFCYYCISRAVYSMARAALLRKPVPAKPCQRHGRGLLLTLALLPFVGSVCLIVLGLILR
jgi:hypothetical protein